MLRKKSGRKGRVSIERRKGGKENLSSLFSSSDSRFCERREVGSSSVRVSEDETHLLDPLNRVWRDEDMCFVQIRNDKPLSTCVLIQLKQDLLDGRVTVGGDSSDRL